MDDVINVEPWSHGEWSVTLGPGLEMDDVIDVDDRRPADTDELRRLELACQRVHRVTNLMRPGGGVQSHELAVRLEPGDVVDFLQHNLVFVLDRQKSDVVISLPAHFLQQARNRRWLGGCSTAAHSGEHAVHGAVDALVVDLIQYVLDGD